MDKRNAFLLKEHMDKRNSFRLDIEEEQIPRSQGIILRLILIWGMALLALQLYKACKEGRTFVPQPSNTCYTISGIQPPLGGRVLLQESNYQRL
jgi:hypothetical protein